MIEIAHLQKLHDDTLAVKTNNSTIPAGVVCGLIGPNGAGKTTAIALDHAAAGHANLAPFDDSSRVAEARLSDSGGADFAIEIALFLAFPHQIHVQGIAMVIRAKLTF